MVGIVEAVEAAWVVAWVVVESAQVAEKAIYGGQQEVWELRILPKDVSK